MDVLGYLKGKSAIKTAASRLGLDFSKYNALLSKVKNDPKIKTVEDVLNASKKFKDLSETDPEVKNVISIAKSIEGNIQSTGCHAAGVILCHKDISDVVPIIRTKEGLATAWSDKIVEKLGLIKYDLLGLLNLSTIDLTLSMLEDEIDIDTIPLNDDKTYSLLQSGNSNGVFQLESSGMKGLLKKLQPTEIKHIDAVVALYRPGAMQFIDEYISNKKDPENISYIDDRVIDIFKNTNGQMIYQEKVHCLNQLEMQKLP